MGVNTRAFGPHLWKVLHKIAQLLERRKIPFTMENKERYFGPLRVILPCVYCRKSYPEYFEILSRKEMSPTRFVYELHNMVNEKLNKQIIEGKHPAQYKPVGIRNKGAIQYVKRSEFKAHLKEFLFYAIAEQDGGRNVRQHLIEWLDAVGPLMYPTSFKSRELYKKAHTKTLSTATIDDRIEFVKHVMDGDDRSNYDIYFTHVYSAVVGYAQECQRRGFDRIEIRWPF